VFPCDCDLYGPSIALMFGAAHQQPTADAEDRIIPIEAHGVQLMSMGFLLGDGSPVIVRGPLATRYTRQFLQQVAWRDLDILVLDLPPGTGDIQLTIVQTVALPEPDRSPVAGAFHAAASQLAATPPSPASA